MLQYTRRTAQGVSVSPYDIVCEGKVWSGVSTAVASRLFTRTFVRLGKLSSLRYRCLLGHPITPSFCLTEFALMTSRHPGTSILNHPRWICYLIHIQTTPLVLVRDLSEPKLSAHSTRSICYSTVRLSVTGLHLTWGKCLRRENLMHTSRSILCLPPAKTKHFQEIYWWIYIFSHVSAFGDRDDSERCISIVPLKSSCRMM